MLRSRCPIVRAPGWETPPPNSTIDSSVFLSWRPLHDFGLVNKPEHTKEEAEAILKKATPKDYEAFFHEYRNMEIGKDGPIADCKEVDAPF